MTNNAPFPAGRRLVPSVIDAWNRIKGGVDVYSRYLKNIKSFHHSLSPKGAWWVRIWLTLIYNAYQSYKLIHTYEWLMSEHQCKSYESYQHHKSEFLPFQDFVRDAAIAIQSDDHPLNISNEENDDEGGVSGDDDEAIEGRQSYRARKQLMENSNSRMRGVHLSEKIKKARRCALCCSNRIHADTNEQSSTTHSHTRRGMKTIFCCKKCNVPLCRDLRWEND